MKEARIEFRASQKERRKIDKIANAYGLNLSDYIRRKLFDENTDLITNEDKYLGPAKERHNFISAAVMHDIYWMIFNFISENKSDENIKEIKNKFRQEARKSITKYGYFKVVKDE